MYWLLMPRACPQAGLICRFERAPGFDPYVHGRHGHSTVQADRSGRACFPGQSSGMIGSPISKKRMMFCGTV
ncbi:MAG: hypothetical protein MAG453_02178 [Calditrichaeota bacterium]|nr:hypothetical protein [Calditrichota bacterium]